MEKPLQANHRHVMKHFVSILVSSIRALGFLILPIAIGIAVASVRGVAPEHIATVVAMPMIAVVLLFKAFSALPPPSQEETQAAWLDLIGKPLWMQVTTIACSLDVLFIAATSASACLYRLIGFSHEFAISYRFCAAGLLLFFVLMMATPLLHMALKSSTFKELRIQPVLCFAFALTVFGPGEIMSGRFPTLDPCHHKS